MLRMKWKKRVCPQNLWSRKLSTREVVQISTVDPLPKTSQRWKEGERLGGVLQRKSVRVAFRRQPPYKAEKRTKNVLPSSYIWTFQIYRSEHWHMEIYFRCPFLFFWKEPMDLPEIDETKTLHGTDWITIVNLDSNASKAVIFTRWTSQKPRVSLSHNRKVKTEDTSESQLQRQRKCKPSAP